MLLLTVNSFLRLTRIEKYFCEKNLRRTNNILSIHRKYSKVFIVRTGHSRLLEFEKKYTTGCLIETSLNNPDINKDSYQVNEKNGSIDFF